MREWIALTLAGLAASPPLQGVVAAVATLVLEDPTTVACGLLVADHRMAFVTAFVGLSVGIAAGDLGLYGLGRLAGPRVVGWGPFHRDRIERGSAWFERNVIGAVLLSRFVPGMRLPTYLAAGLLRAPWWRFTAIVVAASLAWTCLLLSLTVAVGERVLPLLGRYRWPVAAVAVLVLLLLQRRAAGRLAVANDRPPVASAFEFWPPWLFYLPVAAYWLWLALRHRGLLLPTAANPSIFSGGLIGESKHQILSLVPAEQRRWLAPWVTLRRRRSETLERTLERARERLDAAGIRFPVVAKPDVGQRGDGVRPIAGDGELRDYLREFPEDAVLMLQEMVPAVVPDRPGAVHEAGVLLWRLPGETSGTLFSITLKSPAVVVGDGRRSLGELIEADPRARRIRRVYRRRLAGELDRVLGEGERLPLVFAGNHCQGTIFSDGTDLATDALTRRIDDIARSMPGFYFGRFDIRFLELERFLAGDELKIIEINGASAEATHIWDASMDLASAYAALFAQHRAVFAIGAANRRRGHRPMGVGSFVRELLAYRRLARRYPMTR